MRQRYPKIAFTLLLIGLIPVFSSCISDSIGRTLAKQQQYDLHEDQLAENLSTHAIIVGTISQLDGKKYDEVSFRLSNRDTEDYVILELTTVLFAGLNIDFKKPEIGTVYAHKVPAGTYDFYPLFASIGLDTYRAAGEIPQSTWNLEAGKVYYLGNTHLTVLTTKNFIGVNALSGLIMETRENWDFDKQQLEKKYPWLPLNTVEMLKAETIKDGEVTLAPWRSTVIY